MYLKSLDILGYKSFAAKTHLDLEPGITGIIGPNGCGKSNIMEAVRWCLGEMSWKSLRADSMVEVIFAGTAKRPALSMAEVVLTFDNSSSLLPVQFSEVTVSRRIYRSGESAYYLNKTQCRLRDIREMFLDTGLGGDGYAIIDQGGVDAMIVSKPEERRAFFEEAAGVAKYKAKREEALRKLERVEMDMGRLQDSVALITEQVKKLDSDARKAKLFQKYKEELSAMEAAHILQQVGALEGELAAIFAQMAPVSETLGQRRVESAAEGANLSALSLEKADQQNQVIAENQKIAEVKSEIGRLEERIEAARRSAAETDARSAACEGELSVMRERLGAIGPELERAQAAAAEAEGVRAAAESEVLGWRGQLEVLAARLSEAERGIEALRSESLAAAERVLARRRRFSEAESAGARRELEVRAALKDLDRDLAEAQRARTEIESLQVALAGQQAASIEASRASGEAEGAVAGLRRRFQELSEETVRLHSELAEAKARAEALDSQGGQNPYWTGAQAVLNAGIEGVVGTVRQLLRVEEPFKPYLEDLLGERLYAVVCEDSRAARAAIEFLDDSGKGRARFLVLSALPPGFAHRVYPEEAKPLIQHVQFDPRYAAAVRFLLDEAYSLGRALFGDHWVYGGAAGREGPSLSLADVGELRSRILSCEERGTGLSADREACGSEIALAEARARAAAAEAAAAAAREQALAGQIADKEASLALCLRNVELSTAESGRFLAEIALATEDIRGLRAEIVSLEEAEKGLRAKETEASAGLGVLREEAAQGRATEEILRSKLESIQEKLTFLAGAHERLSEEKKGLEASLERRLQELSDLASRKVEATSLEGESRQALTGLQERLAGLEGAALRGFERLQELEKAIAEKEAALRALQSACDAAQEKLHELELQASSRRGTLDMSKQRLWDDWQLTYEDAKAKYAGQEADAERIEFLKKRIVSLGNVNMAAPEEYEALTQRHGFLSSQINDLTQARDDLKAAIQKINGATRENFRQTFIEVREHFRRLFGVLFEGGEADLVLTEPENILETGVEIVAQPPGKRLQSITLLSGGEKTLTAIALLFAFFLVKPSPFCMLDEADAALDDANVERFVSLLKEFQNRTQFLIVSHNKRTMEAADVIYGVTMEELGVSQLISVDFRGKAAPAEPPKEPATEGPLELVSAEPAPEAPASPEAEGSPPEAPAV